MTSQTPIVELIGITKSFGPVDVLKGIDFKVYAGRLPLLWEITEQVNQLLSKVLPAFKSMTTVW